MSFIFKLAFPHFSQIHGASFLLLKGGTNLGGRLVPYKSERLLFLEDFLWSGVGQKEVTPFSLFF